MKKIKLAGIAAAILSIGLFVTACGANPASSPTADGDSAGAEQKIKIGSMIWNTSVPFYSNFIKGQQETAAELGVELTIVDGKGDIGAEVAGVQQLIAQGVDAIIVTPSDAKGIVPAIKKANEAGIPVFAANNRADDTAAELVTFVGADDVEFGRQQAILVKDTLQDGGKVAYMMGALGTSAQLLRKQGFDEVLKDYPDIEVVESQTADWDAAKALALTQVWLGKYGAGELDAIVAQGPEAANSAKYAKESGRDDIKFILGDYPAEVKQGIEAGYIFGTVDQDPRPQGERSVAAAVQWVQGDKSKVIQPNEYLELPIVTKENVADFPAAWGA
ncbi:MAG: sugar ABC transporter substrate-binding protein [Propionibacteriaceae bacterium]|jgi:ABC-type sugar transport system substrate-binding protein|nr:sugar ABC transporter substrate-binding protein [Propionibacteriaceae bacterium]